MVSFTCLLQLLQQQQQHPTNICAVVYPISTSRFPLCHSFFSLQAVALITNNLTLILNFEASLFHCHPCARYIIVCKLNIVPICTVDGEDEEEGRAKCVHLRMY